MFIKSFCISAFIVAFLGTSSIAQVSVKDSAVTIPMFSGNLSMHLPAFDLKERFGLNSGIGSTFFVKTKNNWIFGVDYHYLFGNNVKNKDSILSSIVNSNGFVISLEGKQADIYFYERGFTSSLKFGKLFPVFGPNPNSGLVLIGSGGLLQHKIKIENPENTAPQLSGDYIKGYDKLTNGFSVSEFIGYMYLGNTRLVSFYCGIEFTQAWTKSRRNYDFNIIGKDETKRFDMLYGIKAGWIFPIYPRVPDKYYFY